MSSVPRGRRSRPHSLSSSDDGSSPRRHNQNQPRRRSTKHLQNLPSNEEEEDTIHTSLVGNPLAGDPLSDTPASKGKGIHSSLVGNPLAGNPLKFPNRAGNLPGVDLPVLSKTNMGTFGESMRRKEEEKGDDAFSLRLDLNLEVDIRISARVHGDVSLALR